MVSTGHTSYFVDNIASAESCDKLARVVCAQGYRAVYAPVKKIIIGNKQ